MSTTATTIARYNVITDGGSAPSYRDREFAQIVARRDRAGVLSDVQVVVSWGGHEGRMPISGEHTLASLAENAGDFFDGLLGAIEAADLDALVALIREATNAHTKPIDLYMETTDFEAVRDTVAAALGVDPHGIPTTSREAIEWRSNFVAEDFVEIAAA